MFVIVFSVIVRDLDEVVTGNSNGLRSGRKEILYKQYKYNLSDIKCM